MRNKKAGKHNIFFQPMFILELEIILQVLPVRCRIMKEFSVSFTPYDIYSNIKKSSVGQFFWEKSLRLYLKEESPHEEMFDYIEESIIYFDGCKEGYANFHIAFLAGLSSFLGFEPGLRADTGRSFFDMKEWSICSNTASSWQLCK